MQAKELKAILKKLKVTPSELAEQMGVARNTVNRWCMGSHVIPLWAKKFVDLLYQHFVDYVKRGLLSPWERVDPKPHEF